MSSELFYLPFRPALDMNSLIIPGAILHFYLTGTSTTETIYSDVGLTTPLANPVIATSAGIWPAIYLDDAVSYRVVLEDSDGSTIPGFDFDPYIPGIADVLTEVVYNNIKDLADAAAEDAAQVAIDADQVSSDKAAAETAAAAALASSNFATDIADGEATYSGGEVFYVVDAEGDLVFYEMVGGSAVATGYVMPSSANLAALVAAAELARAEAETAEIGAEAAEAAATLEADRAVSAASIAESLVSPNYSDAPAGLAGTVDGDGFAVDNGDGTVTIYLNEGGTAVEQRALATSAALASSSGAGLVGTVFGGLASLLAVLLGGRSLSAATFASSMPNGTIFTMGGRQYQVDSTAVGSLSATDDLGVAGLVPFGAPTPYHFGATGVGDDASALNSFFSHITARYYDEANAGGTFSIDSGITFGSAGVSPLTSKITGNLSLTATSQIDDMLLLTDCGAVIWDSLTLRGQGGTSFASRTCHTGIRMDDCRRQIFRRLVISNFLFAGMSADQNNNSLSQFGDVKVTDCGSGAVNYSLTGNWSAPVNSGSSGSTAQRTVISVDELPPTFVQDGRYGAVGDSPCYVRLDGDLHYIYSVDAGAGELSVFPWVKSTATPGSFEYVFGGGVYQRGSDCNVNSFSSIDAIRCGTALAAASLYGPNASRIVTQFCGIGISVGRTPAGAALGGSYTSIYFENNQEDIVIVMRTGTNAYNYFEAEYALDMSLVQCLGAPRLTGDLLSTSFETLKRHSIRRKGDIFLYEKKSRSSTSSSYTEAPNRRDQKTVLYRNANIINLGELDVDLNRLTGVDSSHLTLIGSGTNNAPSGTQTFNAPAGWTINGGAGPVVFSGLTNALNVVIHWNISSLDVTVAQL